MKTIYILIFETEDGMRCNSNWYFTTKIAAHAYAESFIAKSSIFRRYEIEEINPYNLY